MRYFILALFFVSGVHAACTTGSIPNTSDYKPMSKLKGDFRLGVDLDTAFFVNESLAQQTAKALHSLGVTNLRLWHSVKVWGPQPNDPQWPCAPEQLRYWAAAFRNLGYTVTLTVAMDPGLIPTATADKVTQVFTSLQSFFKGAVDRWSIGNEIGFTDYWPVNGSARVPVNYVQVIFNPAQKALVANDANAKVYLTSTWCHYYMGTDLMQQMLEDLKANSVWPTGGFDCHNYQNSSNDFTSYIDQTKAQISAVFPGKTFELILSEFNFQAETNRQIASDVTKTMFTTLKVNEKVAEADWYILKPSGGAASVYANNALLKDDFTDNAFAQWVGAPIINLADSFRVAAATIKDDGTTLNACGCTCAPASLAASTVQVCTCPQSTPSVPTPAKPVQISGYSAWLSIYQSFIGKSVKFAIAPGLAGVQKVEYVNTDTGALIATGSDLTDPLRSIWLDMASGTYNVKARPYNADGNYGDSNVVQITVK